MLNPVFYIRSILLALSRLSGVALPELPPLPDPAQDNAPLLAKLADSLQSLPVAGEGGDAHKEQLSELVEWVQRADDYGAWMTERNLSDVSDMLGTRFERWDDAAKALEAHVIDAPASRDAEIIALLAAIEGRRLQVFGPTRLGLAARNVVLPQTRD